MSRPSPVIAVLHRDPQLLVLLKPTGIATTSPDGTRCLAEEARKLDPRAPMVHPTSRLDADVSGVVIFARTREASDALMQARREGRYARTYLAIVERTPEPEEGRWSWPIAIDARDPRLRRALEPGQTGERMQEASSRYAVRARGELASLLSLWPETGRTHQLRVHASRAGSPIVGDTQYGGAARLTRADGRVMSARRTMLHCAHVVVPDVARGGAGTLELRAPVPDDMRAMWAFASGDEESLG